MKKLLLASAVASALGAPIAAIAADSPHTVTANVGFVSDYRFRGLSQTYGKPAVQGGFDYSHSSGFYAGTWGSNLSGNQYPNGAGLEWDFYGGYKMTAGPVGLDFGALYYWYPGAYYNGFLPRKPKYDNTELYGAVSWNWLTLKYSHTTSDLFGINGTTSGALGCGITSTGAAAVCSNPIATTANSKGSGYLDLSGTYEVSKGFNLIGHYGHQTVKNYGALSYSDWKLGATYDYVGFTWGLAYVDTNAEERYYRAVPASAAPGETKYIGKSTVVLSVLKTF
jgi:hypothetical protein